MTVAVKICGLSTQATVDAAVAGGASHVGFVVFRRSPRNVLPDEAGALRTPARVTRVGVFVDPDDALLDHAVRAMRLDVVQLHGGEPPARLAAIQARHPEIELWKAIPVRSRVDLDAAAHYHGVAHRLLFDAKPPAADLPGGMGLRFDWRLLDGFAHRLPWALSGGLDADSVADAVGITGAALVDVSSGVESAPGVKDVDKIGAFLQAVARL